ncbi:hypothetical protein [Comamonas odontotermitis]|uniref:hypothetical protein n=1 Tax=Comamonas odontotermitis TaxID=379895 RepID=UPI001608812B|nr:hypothetical protein [Comamonas odontotermitis]
MSPPVGFSVRGIVAMAGGSTTVAERCGITLQAVRKWSHSIPEEHARTVAIAAGLPLAIVRPDQVQEGADA